METFLLLSSVRWHWKLEGVVVGCWDPSTSFRAIKATDAFLGWRWGSEVGIVRHSTSRHDQRVPTLGDSCPNLSSHRRHRSGTISQFVFTIHSILTSETGSKMPFRKPKAVLLLFTCVTTSVSEPEPYFFAGAGGEITSYFRPLLWMLK